MGKTETDKLAKLFEIVEDWHVHGDDYVAEAATIGLLESIQNQLGGSDRTKKNIHGIAAQDFEK